MFEWSEEQLMVREAVRRFVEAEVVPERRGARARRPAALRHRAQAVRHLRHGRHGPRPLQAPDRARRPRRRPWPAARSPGPGRADGRRRRVAAMTLIPIIELCHYCPGIVTAMGVSMGLAGGTIMKKGTIAQMERWGLDLLTMEKVGAWAITEPELGLRRPRRHAYHGPARRRRVRPQRQQDVHHQRALRRHHRRSTPSSTRATAPTSATARCSPSCSTRACPGSSSRSPSARWACTPRPPASCSSPTCASGATACSARPRTRPRAVGGESAKDNFITERSGVAAMSLGVIEECLKLSVAVRQGPHAVGQPHRRLPAHPAQAGQDGGGPPQRAEPGVPPHRDAARPARASRWPRPRP